MSQDQIILTLNGLRNIQQANLANDFTFFVGENSYCTNTALACFISPYVSSLLATDPTTDHVKILIDDKKSQFNMIMDMLNGKIIKINEDNMNYLIEIGLKLKNPEIVEKALNYKFSLEPLSLKNIMDKISEMVECRIDHQETIQFAKDHFCEIEFAYFQEAEPNVLFYLFSLENLKVSSEDQFFEITYNLVKERGHVLFHLFDNVLFEFLSPENMSKFLQIATPDNVSGRLWSSLSKRLALKVFPDWKSENRHVYLVDEDSSKERSMNRLDYDEKNEWKGIINYLWEECKENPHNSGQIFVGVSSTYNGVHHQSVIDFSWENYWYSTNEKNSFFSVDFLHMLIVPRYYEIRNGKSGFSLRSWVFEASTNGVDFEILDEHSQCDDFRPKLTRNVYKVNNPENKEFRVIRIRQTDKNNSNTMNLELSRFEIYGDLIRVE